MSHLTRYPNQFFEPTPVRQAVKADAGTEPEPPTDVAPASAAPVPNDERATTAPTRASSGRRIRSAAAPIAIDTLALLGLEAGMLVHGAH